MTQKTFFNYKIWKFKNEVKSEKKSILSLLSHFFVFFKAL